MRENKRKGHLAHMAYFKCEVCGYSLSQPIKWVKAFHPVCMNGACHSKLKKLFRKGKLTADQLTPAEKNQHEANISLLAISPNESLAQLEALRKKGEQHGSQA